MKKATAMMIMMILSTTVFLTGCTDDGNEGSSGKTTVNLTVEVKNLRDTGCNCKVFANEEGEMFGSNFGHKTVPAKGQETFRGSVEVKSKDSLILVKVQEVQGSSYVTLDSQAVSANNPGKIVLSVT